MKKHFFVPAIALFLTTCICCGGAEGVVTASFLNARVFPELKSPAAVKLPRGKKVEIFKRHGAWLEIAAPDITPVYASAAFLSGNVAIRDINLRIRPYGKAAVIARIKKGQALKAVSEPDRYGWVQVAPLPSMRLYVMRDYVSYDAAQVPVAALRPVPADLPVAAAAEKKADPAPVKKEEKKAAPAPVKKEEKKAAPAPVKKEEKKAAPAPVKKEEKKAAPAPAKKDEKKAAPAPAKKDEKKAAPAPAKKAEKKAVPAPVKKAEKKFELLPQRKRELINIGTDITKNSAYKKAGRLVAVPNPSGDCTTYALVGIADGRSLGFIFAEAPVDLKKMVDKTVEVKGYAYKVSGWQNPVVCATEVKTVGE